MCLYLTLSRNNAKRIVWPEFKRLNRQFKLEGDLNESDLSISFPNGSVVYLSGASDASEIEKFRGLALKKVYIDECQSFPHYIEALVDEVLAPALMDYNGSLCLIGTPGPIPSGYFYDCHRSQQWSHHFWSFFNNPHIARKSGHTHQDLLDRELRRRGVDASNPSIQREWFGNWVLDSDSLVYKYEHVKNDFVALPAGKYTYILGVDIGFNDADALAVLAWNDASNSTYLVEELITRKQGTTELVEQIRTLQAKYDISKIVMDQGGLGKKIAEEIIRRYQIAVEPAEKTRKAEYIELMNDALRTGSLKIKASSRFAQDAMKVEWDADKCTPDKRVISNRFHSDICEAVLYAWRYSYSFTYRPAIPKPKQGTPQWLEELEEQALQFFLKDEENKKDPYGG